MNFSSSFQLLRTCAAASSSRTLARPYMRTLPGRVSGRNYSDDKAASDKPKDDASTPEKKDVSEVEAKIKAKEAEVADLKSRLQYLQADFLNLQRNAAKEKEQTKDFAITRFASDLLETVDVLAIALKTVPHAALSQSSSAPAGEGLEKSHAAYLKDLHTGVEMTHRMLSQTLGKYHIKAFDPTGEKFNPNNHEALYQVPIPGKEPGTVIDTQKIGYTIKDRVLRAAQVGVAQDTS